MPGFDEITHEVKDKFEKLDQNKDGKLSKSEFSKLEMPNLSVKDKYLAFTKIAQADGDTSSISTQDVKKTIEDLEKRDVELRFKEVADRLEQVFGKKVFIPNVRDFTGTPSFNINAGRNQDEAEKIIDKLIVARSSSGLSVSELPFGSNESGEIIIHGGKILNYTNSGPDVVSKIFEKLEDPENIQKFRDCFPELPQPKLEMEEISQRMGKIFNLHATYTVSGTTVLLTYDKDNGIEVVDKLIEVREQLGFTRKELGFIEGYQGRIGIEGAPFITKERNEVEEVLKVLEMNSAKLQECLK